MKVSINICTRNRAASLRATLDSLSRVRVPPDVECELIVVDNGSTDDTSQVVREADLPHMSRVHLVCEPLRGVARARNRALAESQGEILLCADDDVLLPANWIEGMIAPIVEGRAQAVAGGVTIAPHLMRFWMEAHHKMWLASTYHYKPDAPTGLIGANMALSRAVLDRVPGYDPELGSGGLGFGEETLFAEQIKRAGFKIGGALDVAVEHHFDASRLQRQSLLERARTGGESFAYIHYHFQHMKYRLPRLRLGLAWLKLQSWRIRNRRLCREPEGLSEKEMMLVHDFHHWKGFLRQTKRARNYSDHGFVKLAASREA